LPIKAFWAGLSIARVVNSNLNYISSHYILYKVYLHFLLFGPSILVYIPAEPIILLDILYSKIRDGVEMGGSSKEEEELGGEERGDNSNK
jgi:hypothetical protein